jgi:hypothetical protein
LQIPRRRPAPDRRHALINVRPRWSLEASIDDLIAYHRGQAPTMPQIAASAAA